MNGIELDEIVSIEYVGVDETYDLEVDHPDHTFYANNVSVSNSHAIAYSINSYQSAWFLTYYPDEWITTYLDYCATSKGKQSGKEAPLHIAIKEARNLGYNITKADINESHFGYSVSPTKANTLVPSFGSLKGIGKAAMIELEHNRPYRTLKDLIVHEDGSWKHSKFSKTALATLIQLEALDSMSLVGENKTFANYKQLYHVLVEHYDKLKAITKRKKNNDVTPFLNELIKKASSIEDWTQKEKINLHKVLSGSVSFDLLVPPQTQRKLHEMNAISLDDWEQDIEEQVCWGIVSSASIEKTKTGKQYLKVILYAQNNKEYRCNIWNFKQASTNLVPCDIVVGVFQRSEFGFSSFPNQFFKLEPETPGSQ